MLARLMGTRTSAEWVAEYAEGHTHPVNQACHAVGIPLITASILSKKLAEGINGLVMDVKCGRGAFMKTKADATALAESLVKVGTANGLKTAALLTAMESPLGRYVGNAHEVIESIETLKGNGPHDLTDLSVLLAAKMVHLSGLAETEVAAKVKVVSVLASGAGLEVFRRCIEQQGGDPKVIDDYSRLPTAEHTEFVRADRAGYVSTVDAEKVGVAAMQLGAGRERSGDGVDHAVGVIVRAKPGERVKAGDVMFEVAYRGEAKFGYARPLLEEAFTIADAPPPAAALVMQEIGT